jgi:hypothetical protein
MLAGQSLLALFLATNTFSFSLPITIIGISPPPLLPLSCLPTLDFPSAQWISTETLIPLARTEAILTSLSKTLTKRPKIWETIGRC